VSDLLSGRVAAVTGGARPWRRHRRDRVFTVDVRGVALCLKHAVSLMPHGGTVVAMGSITSERGAPRQALYNAAKNAMLGIVRTAAFKLGPRDIRVNARGPGPVATRALRGRMAMEEAKATLFLTSDLSSAITGRLLRVDGGLA
jgi:NAD(P)-dependent dehydrogenase (short-subunit alcohol dehydrogenase family)